MKFITDWAARLLVTANIWGATQTFKRDASDYFFKFVGSDGNPILNLDHSEGSTNTLSFIGAGTNTTIGFTPTGTGGLKLCTATTQRLSLYGVTAVVQAASASQAAITDTAGATYTSAEQTMLNNLKTLANQLRADLVALGAIKGSA